MTWLDELMVSSWNKMNDLMHTLMHKRMDGWMDG